VTSFTDPTDPPEYNNIIICCHKLLLVKHILPEFTSYNLTRQQQYSHTNVKDLFNISSDKSIIDFIKNVDLYDKL